MGNSTIPPALRTRMADSNHHRPGSGQNLSGGSRLLSRVKRDTAPLPLVLIVGTALGSAAWFFSSKTKQHNQYDGKLTDGDKIHTPLSPAAGKPKAASQEQARDEIKSSPVKSASR